MHSKNMINPAPYAAVFTGFEYKEIPFERLNQLEKIGIFDIYIIVNNEEYALSQKKSIVKNIVNKNKEELPKEKPFQVFDFSKSQTILEQYQSHNSDSQLKFQVLNCGNLTTEEEKLNFYLENVSEHYLTNLFFYQHDIAGLQQNLQSIAPSQRERVAEFSFMPFFKTTNALALQTDKFTFSPLVTNLLKREINPCFAYHMNKFDVLYHQWLFNVFVELTIFRISTDDQKHTEHARKRLNDLIKRYGRNIIDLQKAEGDFAKTHKEAYQFLEEPTPSIKRHHSRNIAERDYCEEQFNDIIKQTMDLYQAITKQQIVAHKIFISTI